MDIIGVFSIFHDGSHFDSWTGIYEESSVPATISNITIPISISIAMTMGIIKEILAVVMVMVMVIVMVMAMAMATIRPNCSR